ncbi:hypothetical protein RU98_GL000739 [Enterococcus caccae]|nr:hypothetical protein RU98_GL000739 [Enterococcus caccae]
MQKMEQTFSRYNKKNKDNYLTTLSLFYKKRILKVEKIFLYTDYE